MAVPSINTATAKRPQFRLGSLLVFVTACAVLAVFVRMLEAATWLPEPPGEAERLVAACFAALCGGGVFCGLFQSATQQARFVLAAAGTVVLLVLQVFSLTACWHVYGEVAQLLNGPVPCVVLVPPALCAMGSFRSSALAALLLAALTAPIWGSQIVLVSRLKLLHAEVGAIVEYAEAEKLRCGDYPLDLSEYRFRHPSLAHRIEYCVPHESPGPHYLVVFKLFEGDMTTREYSPIQGWYYYPD